MQRIIVPLESLAQTAQAIAQGDLSRQATIASDDEIGALAATFNSMTTQIRQSLEGMQQQVAELELAKEALRQSEQKYRQLFENAGDIVYTFDMAGNVTAVNPAITQITGYTPEEILEMGFMEIIHPDDRRMVAEMMGQKLAGEHLESYETRIITKDGRTVMLELNSTALKEDGQAYGLPVEQLKAGMRLLVTAGERIAADGVVLTGRSEIDSSLISGETLPGAVVPGDDVYAGTINLGAPLTLRVSAVGEGTLLGEIVRLLEVAEQRRARFVALADRVARLYAPVVHVLALVTFLGWLLLAGLTWQASLLKINLLMPFCPLFRSVRKLVQAVTECPDRTYPTHH